MGWRRFFSIAARRQYLARKSRHVELQQFYQHKLVINTDFAHASLAVLDLETSGLDPKLDEILSMGVVHIDHGQIELASAWHQTIKPEKSLPASSILIHQLTDDELQQAPTLEQVLPTLLQKLAGRVLVAHHSNIELSFIQQTCRRLYGDDFYIPVIDTLVLAQKKLHKQHTVFAANSLRLANVRAQYDLPRLKAHNALSDALATAELLLAQTAEMAGNEPLPLRRLLKSRLG